LTGAKKKQDLGKGVPEVGGAVGWKMSEKVLLKKEKK